jgi:hypothetical protein
MRIDPAQALRAEWRSGTRRGTRLIVGCVDCPGYTFCEMCRQDCIAIPFPTGGRTLTQSSASDHGSGSVTRLPVPPFGRLRPDGVDRIDPRRARRRGDRRENRGANRALVAPAMKGGASPSYWNR